MAFDKAAGAQSRAPQDSRGASTAATPRLRMASGAVLLAGAVVLVAAGLTGYRLSAPHGLAEVRFQWAGSQAAAIPVISGRAGAYRLGLLRDLDALVPGYTLGLLAACYLGRRVFWTRQLRGWATAGMTIAGAAGLLNVAQDWLLLTALGGGRHSTWAFRAAQALPFAKFSALLAAAAIGILALATTLGRLVMHRRTRKRWEAAIRHANGNRTAEDRPLVIPPPPVEAAPATAAQAGEPAADVGDSWWRRRPGWAPHPLGPGLRAARQPRSRRHRHLRARRGHPLGLRHAGRTAGAPGGRPADRGTSPCGDLAALRPSFLSPGQHRAPAYPAVPAGVWLAIGSTAALSVLAYLISAWGPGSAAGRRSSRAISRFSGWLAGAAALLGAIGVALPALIWAGSWLTWQLQLSRAAAAAAGSLSLVLGYLGTLAATLWRKRTTVAESARTALSLFARGPVNQVLPVSA